MVSPAKSTALPQARRKQAVRTWLRLLSCESAIEQELRSRLRSRFAVTLPQFDVLSELERADEPLSMSQLSKELMVSNGNVTGVIDRLEKAGLVRRSRAEHDRRVQYIRLTRRGRRHFDRMAACHEDWLDELLSELSPRDMLRLQQLLLKARDSVNRRRAADGRPDP